MRRPHAQLKAANRCVSPDQSGDKAPLSGKIPAAAYFPAGWDSMVSSWMTRTSPENGRSGHLDGPAPDGLREGDLCHRLVALAFEDQLSVARLLGET